MQPPARDPRLCDAMRSLVSDPAEMKPTEQSRPAKPKHSPAFAGKPASHPVQLLPVALFPHTRQLFTPEKLACTALHDWLPTSDLRRLQLFDDAWLQLPRRVLVKPPRCPPRPSPEDPARPITSTPALPCLPRGPRVPFHHPSYRPRPALFQNPSAPTIEAETAARMSMGK